MAWKNAKGGFVYWLNRLLNPDHPWTDYYDPTTDETVPRSEQGTLRGDSASYGAGSLSSSSLFGTLGKGIEALINKWTDAAPTGGEIGRNEMQMQNAEDIYQRQVAGMQNAGVNPALMYQNGAPTPPSVSTASSGSASMSDMMQLFMMPLQKRLLEAQSQQARDLGKAALINAGANVRNAGANERNAGTNERNAGTNERNADTQRFDVETRRMMKDIEERKVRIYESLTEEQKKEIAERCAMIKLQREQLPKQLDIAQQHADADTRRAIASLRQADAAVQNAATNDRLADYETSLKYAQEMITWANKDGRDIVNRYLDDRQRTELDNLVKEGVYLDKRGELVDRQGHLVTAQTVKTYVNVATDVSGAVNQWLNPFSKGAAGSQSPGFDLSGAYQGVAYGYE